jgi:hypothetical protein
LNGRHGTGDVLGEADLDGLFGGGANGLDGEAVSEDSVVSCLHDILARKLQSWSGLAGGIACVDERVELVDRHPVLNAVG